MVSVSSLYADPNERAQDMIIAYQRECNNMKVKPVTKLMEQLEVCCKCTYTCTYTYISVQVCVCWGQSVHVTKARQSTCTVHENHCHGGARQAVIPGQRCFELVSSHQQGIRITCLAHHPALYTHGEPECLWFCDIRTNEVHMPLQQTPASPRVNQNACIQWNLL